MNAFVMKNIAVRAILALSFGAAVLNAAVGDVTPLSRSEFGQVETVLSKLLKGKPTLLSGTKQEVDGGWRVNCVANVGSGGSYEFVVVTEKTLTLGYIDSQKPHVAPATKAPETKGAATKK
jgi:invasion protein IalB